MLSEFLEAMPKVTRAAFEFRHPSWFEDEIFTLLRAHNAALCIAESAEFATPAVCTADFGYLRLRRENYKVADIERWAGFVREQSAAWEDAFVYFKHEARGVGPKFGRRMQRVLQKTASVGRKRA